MKPSLQQKEDALSITTKDKSNLQIRVKNNFFNHIDKLAADHDVTVSNTMIKITYKKALKDQNASEATVNCKTDSDVENVKAKPTETKTLCNSDFSIVLKPAVVPTENNVFHSVSKPQTEIEKKKNYLNGINLLSKSNNLNVKGCVIKVQKKHSSQEGPSSLKEPKMAPNKPTIKQETDKKFLKGEGLVKQKGDIICRSSSGSKKVNYNNAIDKKIKKLGNGMKKKTGVDKKIKKVEELKRKMPSPELELMTKHKKLKIGENDSKIMEDNRCLKESNRSGSGSNKRSIMLVDPELPSGWTRLIKTKNKGLANEQYIVYVVDPQGKKFRFKWKLRNYLKMKKSSLDPDKFFFGLYHRPKSSNTSGIEKEDASTINSQHISLDKSPKNFFGSESDRLSKPKCERDEKESYDESKTDANKRTDERELLLFDPDLPFGWKRIIHSSATNGKKQVHIISPDGKVFRKRSRLNEYLNKHHYTHSLDRFYFGLYPKKQRSVSENSLKETKEKNSSCVKSKYRSVSLGQEKETNRVEENQKGRSIDKTNKNYLSLIGKRKLCLILRKIDESGVCKLGDLNSDGSAMIYNKTIKSPLGSNNEGDNKIFKGGSKTHVSNPPMYVDPNLPKGWKRLIQIRSCGKSAGRMEVIIVSPDGRKHRSKKHLEHYLEQKHLKYKAKDFDFTLIGRNPKRRPTSKSASEKKIVPEFESKDLTFLGVKKKFPDKLVAELDSSALKDTEISHEGQMINTVNGLMMCTGLSSIRNERRPRLPRVEHEKILKSYLSLEGDVSFDGCDIPTHWIQRLVRCRSEFRILEPDAASAIAEATKKFIKALSLQALANSKEPESELRYEDVAELVDKIEGVPFLKALIPKKITYKEYIKLNRPKQFMSFT